VSGSPEIAFLDQISYYCIGHRRTHLALASDDTWAGKTTKNADIGPNNRHHGNDRRQAHSYNGRLIGNCIQAFNCYHFWWPWMTLSDHLTLYSFFRSSMLFVFLIFCYHLWWMKMFKSKLTVSATKYRPGTGLQIISATYKPTAQANFISC